LNKKKDTFNLTLKYLYENQKSKKKSGKLCELCVEDKLLITFDFFEEKQKFFHLATRPFRNTQGILVDTGYTGILKLYGNNANILILPKERIQRSTP
jgi:hypothetical protein